MMFVEVAINLPRLRGTFDYHLPSPLQGRVKPGHLITAPFGHRNVQGIVVNLLKRPSVAETRPIEELLDPEPVLTPDQLELARWIEKQTLAPLIECLTLMLPPGLSQKADSLYTLLDSNAEGTTKNQKRIIDLLTRRGPLRGRQISRALPRHNWRPAANGLVRRGVLNRTSVLDPPRARAKRVRIARLTVSPQVAHQTYDDLGLPGRAAAGRRRAILEMLIQEGEPLEVQWLYAECGAKLADLHYLEERNLISLSEAEVWRDPIESIDFVPSTPPRLTSDQANAWEVIQGTVHKAATELVPPILLHGVTGSGKTELYLRAVSETLALGRSAIVLVPEIALTPQTVRRFLARFPGQVGLLHSQLSDGERYDTWRRSRAGTLQVIVGPRSALFAPLPDIGLIVVDESHDESYKEQGRSPRYHTREACLSYSRIIGATCILGSATPDIVSTYRAERGELVRVSLPQRILGHRERIGRQAARLGVTTRYKQSEGDADAIALPPVRVVDMRQELRAGNRSLFSRALQAALSEVLEANQQAILFLNRRGSSTYVFCRDCGWVSRCPHCETSLTYHLAQERLMCHHCGYTRKSPTSCPNCEGQRVRHFGAGTQRIQAELEKTYPDVRTLRWDWDVTRAKGAHDIILSHFAAHRADVLIGTQMIAKGLDLPLVTLVGVVSADTGLNLPEYRASERTFQILTQVAGRAGRGLLGGRVILQTYQPEHFAIQAASKHDYSAFYDQELQNRRQLGYPPYRRLAKLVYRHVSALEAENQAKRMRDSLQHKLSKLEVSAEITGPTPCFFRKERGLYRWQILIRATDPARLIPEEIPEGWIVDIDPVTLL
jgi:primosomal protein N' (replication factor Y)